MEQMTSVLFEPSVKHSEELFTVFCLLSQCEYPDYLMSDCMRVSTKLQKNKELGATILRLIGIRALWIAIHAKSKCEFEACVSFTHLTWVAYERFIENMNRIFGILRCSLWGWEIETSCPVQPISFKPAPRTERLFKQHDIITGMNVLIKLKPTLSCYCKV